MAALPSKTEDICQRFLANWNWELSGVQGIARFLSQSAHDRPDGDLLCRLVCVDMQNVWELWADYVMNRLQAGVAVAELLKHWQHLPKFASYDSIFPSSQVFSEQQSELARCESNCRDRWGDAVGPLYYEHYFQLHTEEFQRRTRRLMRCEFESNAEYSQVLFPLRGCNQIGRQRTSDTEAYFCEPGPDGNRIVIANRFEAEISRQQLTIQLLTPDVAVVTNQSRVNYIRLSGDRNLQPQDELLVAFPFTIQLHGRKLSCY